MTNFASLQSWEQVGLHESVTTTTQDVIKPHKPSTTCNVFYILTINGLTLIKFKFKPPVGCVHGAVVAYYLTPAQPEWFLSRAGFETHFRDRHSCDLEVGRGSERALCTQKTWKATKESSSTHADGKVSISQLADLHLQHVYRKEAPCMSDGFRFCHLSTHSQLLRITKARSTNFEVNYWTGNRCACNPFHMTYNQRNHRHNSQPILTTT